MSSWSVSERMSSSFEATPIAQPSFLAEHDPQTVQVTTVLCKCARCIAPRQAKGLPKE